MKIALVSPTPVPPVFGGMDRLLNGLHKALNERHPTDLVTIPFDERSREGVLRGYFDFYNLDLSAYDLVITYKAPAYMVRHPRQVCYLSHRIRVFYDLYEPAGAEHERMREIIHWMDGWALDKRRVPHLFTVGETVCRRLMRYGGIESRALHHPTTFAPAEARHGEYFLSVGRLHPLKRNDLIIRAFRLSKADCPLKIAGEGPHEAELRELAAGDARIKFEGRVSDERLADLYAGAIATIFPPVNEDMGLITFESFLSGKPVLTTEDSGEPALIVQEGNTGFVVSPTSEALTEKIDWMWENRDATEAMAGACRAHMKEITWARLVDALLGAGETDVARSAPIIATNGKSALPKKKIELLVTDNQIIDPPVGGGRVRILELYRHMPEDFNTTYVGAFDYPGPAFRDQQIAPNFREILTPLTARHFKAHGVFHRLTRGDATIDVTMPLLGGLTPRYRRIMDAQIPRADILVCAHPWMFPFLPANPALPRVYDSQNCEAALKGPLLKRTLAGRYLATRVTETERLAIEQSQLILACSEEDAQAFVSVHGAAREKIILAPNGVDCEVIRPARGNEKTEARARLDLDGGLVALFTGSNYVPNLEGAEFIIQRLAPRFPHARFCIAGGVGPMFQERHPGEALPPNVRIFGFVDRETLLDLYRAADVALNPMSQGSGTNIKMLDYMAAALPILTTPKGARGLAGRTGEHWIEAPVESLAAEFESMITNTELRLQLGANARRLAELQYDWAHIAANLAEAFRKLLAERSLTLQAS